MTQIAQAQPINTADALPISGQKFDWAVVISIIWFVGGLFVDGWAHNNGRVDDSFFTPWHAIFYSGFLVVTGVHLFTVYKNHGSGVSWSSAIPRGYTLSLVGLAVFAAGGVGDMVWHETWGIEEGTAALLSPTHLLLALGIGLITTGPIRAAAPRNHEKTLPFTVSVSAAFFISLATFMAQYAYFYDAIRVMTGRPPTVGFYYDMSHVVGVDAGLITTAIFMGTIFFLMRRWQIPAGTFTFIFLVNGFLMGIMNMELIPVVLLPVVGVLMDLLFAGLRPSPANSRGIRLFAIISPIIFLSAYTLAIYFTEGSWWEIHFMTGIPVLAALGSLCLSYLVFPTASMEP